MHLFTCGWVILIVTVTILQLSDAARSSRKKLPADKGEAMYNCLKKQSCDCGKGPELQECFEYMEPETMRAFISYVENCFGLNYTVPNSDAASVACTLPEEGWVRCRNEILDNFNKYLADMYKQIFNPSKQKEMLGVEKAKVCFGPRMSVCASFQDQCV
ncbi:uncharacterized protein LOC129225142 [Uloborus diversus]|uniref:uncharacterized protein LOC129225142 n=1 Tax=Uloborus diversus TaxID=327109 RepID=UPI0024091CE4|nr:uncharacterized protein LOC129225142 [Uloborus diversus]